jgi:hypothetical protein
MDSVIDPNILQFIAYAVGTLLGLRWGFKHGLSMGAEVTVNALIEANYVKTQMINGRTVIVKLDEVSSTSE